jgi:hypothetical protein
MVFLAKPYLVKELVKKIPSDFDKMEAFPLGSVIPRSFALSRTTESVKNRRNHALHALKLSYTDEFI